MSQQPPISPDNGQSGEWQKAGAIAETLMQQQAQQMKAIANLVMIFLGWLAGSIEVFIRFDFGERYLGVLRILFTLWTMQLFTLILTAITSLNNRVNDFVGGRPIPFTTLNQAFVFAFLAVSIAHRLHMGYRNWKEIPWYSHSFGVSWLTCFIDLHAFFKRIGFPLSHMTTDWLMYRWIEPAVCYAIGGFVYGMEPVTGTWIQVSAAALFIKNQMHYYGYYNAVLDARDAAILARVIHADAHGGNDLPKSQTFGITAVKQAAEIVTPATPPIYKQAQASANPADQNENSK